MPWYLLRSYGHDENNEIWLEHDEKITKAKFSKLVMAIAREIVLADDHYEWNKEHDWKHPFPMWGCVIRDVAEVLVKRFGFRRMKAQTSFQREWSDSWDKFLPDAEELIAEQKRRGS